MTARQGHILLQKNIQIKFLAEENEDLRNRVQNLGEMVQANKEIISTMLSSSSSPERNSEEDSDITSALETQFRSQIELLEKRTATLEKQLEDEAAQKLVLTQIIQNLQN